MSNQTGITKPKDYTVGFIRIKPKWNPETKAYTDSGLFEVYVYQYDPATGEPKQTGTRKWKDKNGVEHEQPTYTITAVYTIAISSLTKVISHEAKRCNLYYRKKGY